MSISKSSFVTFLLLIVIAISCKSFGDIDNVIVPKQPSFECGLKCVEYVCKYLDIEVTPQSVYQLCDFQEDDLGMSLSQIKAALEKKGLHCLGFQAPLKNVTRPDFTGCSFVIWTPQKELGHFRVIVKSKKTNLWLAVDPLYRSVYPIENMEENETRTVLLAVSKEKIFLKKEISYTWMLVGTIAFMAVLAALSFLLFKYRGKVKHSLGGITHN